MMDYTGMSEKSWSEVVEALEEIAPDYDKVNSLITFGMAERWRRDVASMASPEDVVLEIGSGPGSFAKRLRSKQVYCLEPSRSLAEFSRRVVDDNRTTLVQGVGESIPLADGSVDKVFCVFSFRDFLDKPSGTSEIFRVLKEGGQAFIVDRAKPPPGPWAKLLEMHVRHVVPRLARVAVSPAAYQRLYRDPYRTFVDTYEAFGFTTVYENLLRSKGFEQVGTEFLRLRGATMTRGKKPWKSTSS
jgi:demethylmenaquinone methyltransferase / 2-methoxy-6-polyprenyl-1,4-benzoquinol methylase